MKAYIGNVDWADEGDVFFFSVESEENLKTMRGFIETLVDLDLVYPIEMYWGTNESFEFDANDFFHFIDTAKDISDEELAVFNKFKVSGFDIYKVMLENLPGFIHQWDYPGWAFPNNLNEEGLNRIKPFYIKLYGQEEWNELQQQWISYNQ